MMIVVILILILNMMLESDTRICSECWWQWGERLNNHK